MILWAQVSKPVFSSVFASGVSRPPLLRFVKQGAAGWDCAKLGSGGNCGRVPKQSKWKLEKNRNNYRSCSSTTMRSCAE
jgi:hypothetical protein